MKKEAVFVGLLLIFLSGFLVFFQIWQSKERVRVCFKGECFKVRLAITPEQIRKGLMYEKKLGKRDGMLFIFKEEGIYPFWMKNTLIPLDIIWINKNKEVVFISKNTQPCREDYCPTINPSKKAKYVLEIKGGAVDETGLQVGDRVNIEMNLTKNKLIKK